MKDESLQPSSFIIHSSSFRYIIFAQKNSERFIHNIGLDNIKCLQIFR